MEAEQLLYAVSTFGAACFFGAGYFLSRRGGVHDAKPSEPATLPIDTGLDAKDVARLKADLDASEKARQQMSAQCACSEKACETERASLSTHLEGLGAERDALREEVTRLRSQLAGEEKQNRSLADDLKRQNERVASVDKVLRTAEERAQRALTVEQDNQALKERFEALETERRAVGQRAEQLHVRAQMCDALERKIEAYEEQLAQVGRIEPDAAELMQLRMDMKQAKIETELLSARVKELEQFGHDAVSLRQQVADLSQSHEELVTLRGQARRLQAQLLSAGINPDPVSPADVQRRDLPLNSIDESLRHLVQKSRVHSAVVANGQGFLVGLAGNSSLGEGVAAFAGVLSHVLDRVPDLITMGEVVSVRLVDSNGLMLSIVPLRCSGERILLSLLGPGEPNEAVVRDATRTLLGHMAHTWS